MRADKVLNPICSNYTKMLPSLFYGAFVDRGDNVRTNSPLVKTVRLASPLVRTSRELETLWSSPVHAFVLRSCRRIHYTNSRGETKAALLLQNYGPKHDSLFAYSCFFLCTVQPSMFASVYFRESGCSKTSMCKTINFGVLIFARQLHLAKFAKIKSSRTLRVLQYYTLNITPVAIVAIGSCCWFWCHVAALSGGLH